MLKVISRHSRLAQIQVKEVMDQCPGVPYHLLAMPSLGDTQKHLSLRGKLPSDFFTRELDEALRCGEADVAIHSAKDLPFPLPVDLRIVALTACLDAGDAVVTRERMRIADLPGGARIGTSSAGRQEQLLRLRRDVVFVDIRGTIEERLALLDNHHIDALIVATCALKRLKLEDRISDIVPGETAPLQGHLAVVAKRDRWDMVKMFAHMDVRKHYGKVYLVGFGPGDPELMTIKADKILRHADVIYHDDLVDKEVLEKYAGKKIDVGKRKDKVCQTQEQINHILAQEAMQGQVVVRLKGGDPGIFGRVGEEVEYLQQRMIPLEIVPGVTSAMAAGASQNIALTYRGISNTFSFLTAHHADRRDIKVPDVDTIVYYMGASQLEHLSKRLLAEGRSPNEPVLLVQHATYPQERSEVTTILEMGKSTLVSPLMVIVGAVAGKSVKMPKSLYTGLDPEHYLMRETSYRLVFYPLIETKSFKHAPVDMSTYDAVLFTSRYAVRYFFQHEYDLSQKKVVAIGPSTAAALREHGCAVHHMPDISDSRHVAQLLATLPYQRYLYPCSDRSRNELHAMPAVQPLVIYRTVNKKQDPVNLDDYDEIVFTSSSTVESFFTIYQDVPKHIRCMVLGAFSQQTLKDHGVEEDRIFVVRP